jgi:hypothetical protein
MTTGKRWLLFYRALLLEDRRVFLELRHFDKAFTRAWGGQYGGDRCLLVAFITSGHMPESMRPLAALLCWYAKKLGVAGDKGFVTATLATLETVVRRFDLGADGHLYWGRQRLTRSVESAADFVLGQAETLLRQYTRETGRWLEVEVKPPQLPPYTGNKEAYFHLVERFIKEYVDTVESLAVPAEEKRQRDHYRWLIRRMRGVSASQIAREQDGNGNGVVDESTISKGIREAARALDITLAPLPGGRPKTTN